MEKPTVLLKKSRDFSDVINATFAFISQEFKRYGKVMLYYGGIPILLSAIAGAFFSGTEMSRIFNQVGSMENSLEIFGVSYFLKIALVYILSWLVFVFISGLTAAYMHLYTEKGRNGFEVNEVWQVFTSSIGKLMGFYLLTFLGFLVLGGGISFVIASFSLVGSGDVVAAVTIFLAIVIFLVLVIYVSVPLSLGYVIIYSEKRSFGTLFSRMFQLVKGSWWQSFGVIFVLFLIYSLLSSLFSIPIFISSMMQGLVSATEGDVIGGDRFTFTMIVVSLIGTLGQFIMYPIILIGVGVQYYNLREQKDNDSLLQKVAEMTE
ncbi:hypothetical protein [Geofilum rubicundum]|uniref:Glycerophosphoryl diester phosphodiesterase membrane domain-containing protein n=1 Tax=Geofilum rubicundum JCM 15548 TaxID=1236989 RepID=A0A0E9LVD2_9BACT|nr:hypothetical protein [Geofilum rubicundum]GAO29209.1 hypothetical protein JCM15548_11375 [Geofilum rubicundum JCM 15548]